MAPKERPVEHPSPLPKHGGDDHEEEEETSLGPARSPKASPDRRWKQRILGKLRELWEDERFVSGAKWTAGAALVALVAVRQKRRRANRPAWGRDLSGAATVSLSALRLAATSGLVRRALIGPGEILYQDHSGNNSDSAAWKRTKLPANSPSIQADLLDLLSRNGCGEVSALPETLLSRLGTPALAALPFVYLALVYKIFKNIHGGDDLKLSSDREKRGRTPTRFADVAGLESVMPEVEEIVGYLRNPGSYRALGARPPQGLLLHGPPGSGKTLLAQAVAGEADAAFLSCSGSEFCEMYVGRGAARVRSLFERARSMARQRQGNGWWSWLRPGASSNTLAHDQPPPTAIVFIDEFDALAKSRSYGGLQQGNDERESTLNQLLTEMDGFSSREWNSDVTVIVIAATNRPDTLDPAVLRRFDRQIHVPYPDAAGRRDILRIHARKTNCNSEGIDWEGLSCEASTGGFSGSDLRNLVNDAALLAVRERSSQVTQDHLEHAVRRCRATKSRPPPLATPYGVLRFAGT